MAMLTGPADTTTDLVVLVALASIWATPLNNFYYCEIAPIIWRIVHFAALGILLSRLKAWVSTCHIIFCDYGASKLRTTYLLCTKEGQTWALAQ